MNRTVLLSVLCLLCFLAFTPSQAQQAFEDWNLVCPPAATEGDKPDCHLSQQKADPQSSSTLLLASIVLKGPKPSPFLILASPLGINLPAGLTLKVDRRTPVKLVFNTCTHQGCFAGLGLSKSMLRQFRRGLNAQVTYQDAARRPVKVDLSLRGVTAGLEALGK